MNPEANTFVSNLSQAARDNPLAAALIGGGALWLMFGNRALGGVASVVQPLAETGLRGVSNAADAVTSASGRATDAVLDTARSVTHTAGEALASSASAVRDGVTDAVTHTAETLRATPNPVRGFEKGYAGAQSALTDLLERQPLVLGAIGLAIGAGVASAFASRALENEWAGSLSDDVKDAVTERAKHVAETAQRAAGEIGNDFRAAAGEAADKLRTAGADAVRTVKDTMEAAGR